MLDVIIVMMAWTESCCSPAVNGAVKGVKMLQRSEIAQHRRHYRGGSVSGHTLPVGVLRQRHQTHILAAHRARLGLRPPRLGPRQPQTGLPLFPVDVVPRRLKSSGRRRRRRCLWFPMVVGRDQRCALRRPPVPPQLHLPGRRYNPEVTPGSPTRGHLVVVKFVIQALRVN